MINSNLEQLKAQLQARKEKLERGIAIANGDIAQMANSSPVDDGDYAKINAETDLQSSLIAQQQKEIADIDKALAKIAAGRYGVCEMCDEEIDFGRLSAKPHARYCIDCREVADREKRLKK